MPGQAARTAASASAHGLAASVSLPSSSKGWKWTTRAPASTDARAAAATLSVFANGRVVARAVEGNLEQHQSLIASGVSSSSDPRTRSAWASASSPGG